MNWYIRFLTHRCDTQFLNNHLGPCGCGCGTDPSVLSRENSQKCSYLGGKYAHQNVHSQGLAADRRMKESRLQTSQMIPRTVLSQFGRHLASRSLKKSFKTISDKLKDIDLIHHKENLKSFVLFEAPSSQRHLFLCSVCVLHTRHLETYLCFPL